MKLSFSKTNGFLVSPKQTVSNKIQTYLCRNDLGGEWGGHGHRALSWIKYTCKFLQKKVLVGGSPTKPLILVAVIENWVINGPVNVLITAYTEFSLANILPLLVVFWHDAIAWVSQVNSIALPGGGLTPCRPPKLWTCQKKGTRWKAAKGTSRLGIVQPTISLLSWKH